MKHEEDELGEKERVVELRDEEPSSRRKREVGGRGCLEDHLES